MEFHQFQLILKDIQGINKILLSQYKIKDVNYTTTCSGTVKGSYCQDYNLLMVPQTQLSPTVKTCMENMYIYIIPHEEIDPAS